MKTQLFTIQQFADLHEIGKRTLHFYDQIGLFSPAVKKDNGYRYYSLSQGATLEMILTLRELDVPLDTIKAYMENRTVENFSQLLKDKKKEIDKKIKELKGIRELLSIKQKQLEYIQDDLSSIQVVFCPKKNYAVTFLKDYEENYTNTMIQHAKSLPYHLFNMELGTMNHTDYIKNAQYNHTEAFFSNMGTLKSNHIRPMGEYVRAFHLGDFSDLTPTYQRILEYCEKESLQIEGYSYEVGVNDLCIMNIEEYITMIEIHVKKI